LDGGSLEEEQAVGRRPPCVSWRPAAEEQWAVSRRRWRWRASDGQLNLC